MQKISHRLSFIVPALNEGKAVSRTVRSIKTAGESLLQDFEIVLVDDGSTDDTGAIMERLAAEDSRVRVLHNWPNLGLGGAYLRGVEGARHEYVMLVPGDDCFPPESLTPIIEKMGSAEIVIPYVLNTEVRPWSRRLLSAAFTKGLNFLFGIDVPYYNGLVLHRRDLIKSANISTHSFAYQAEALIKLLSRGHSFTSVGVLLHERSSGGSKALRLKNVRQIVSTILRLFWDVRIRRRF